MKITMKIHQQSTMSKSTSGIKLGIAAILLFVAASVERVSVPLYSDLVWNLDVLDGLVYSESTQSANDSSDLRKYEYDTEENIQYNRQHN